MTVSNKREAKSDFPDPKVSRRQVLKSLGASGISMGALSTEAKAHSPSGEYEVWVFITEEQYYDSGGSFAAQDAVLNYVKGAFSNTDGVSVFAFGPNIPIPAPVEDSYQESDRTFVAEDPCTGALYTYQTLAHWWYDYLNCVQTNHAADSNLLITNHWQRGGYALYDDHDGIAAVAEGGPSLEDDSTYNEFENDYDSRAHRTALEEIGHNLQMTNEQTYISGGHSFGFDHHKTGTTTQTSGYDAHMVTPLGRKLCEETNDKNHCGNFAETDVANCWEYGDWMRYSDCSVHYWNPPE